MEEYVGRSDHSFWRQSADDGKTGEPSVSSAMRQARSKTRMTGDVASSSPATGPSAATVPYPRSARTLVDVSVRRRRWSAVTDLRYDTGEPFSSLSAFAKLLRQSRTRRLYWFGNIYQKPSRGNRPRRPLYIAEVDESIPSLKQDSLAITNDRGPTADSCGCPTFTSSRIARQAR